MILRFVIAALAPPFLFSCSTSGVRVQCWNEENATAVLEKLVQIANTAHEASGEEAIEPRLVEDNCRKRKYELGNARLILMNQKDLSVSGRTAGKSDDPAACLDRALHYVQELHSTVDDEILRLHRERHPEQWGDPDLSPVGWLNCASQVRNDFDDSVSIFLHELTHQLRDEDRQCLWLAVSRKQICFRLPKELPLRSFGKQETFPTTDPAALRTLEAVQKIYLTDTDQPVYFLFDELNAYLVSARNYRDRYEHWGAPKFFDDENRRPGVFLPLFHRITVAWLERLRKEQPDLYRKTFLQDSLNHDSIRTLLAASRNTYRGWLRVLRKSGRIEKDWERKLFAEAMTAERRLGF